MTSREQSDLRPSSVWPWVLMAFAGFITFVAAMTVPPDVVQGQLSRIMYIHVPSAWLAYLSFGVTMLASAMYLWKKDLRWDRRAHASAEIGVFFTGLAIILGMTWAKPTWGVWWTWDARLTLTAIMFFVYLGYLALRRTTDDLDARAKRAAVLGVVAIIQIPLVHFSVIWWRSLHQAPTIIRPEGPEMDTAMVATLFVAVLSFTVMYAAMMVKRIELARIEDDILIAEQTDRGHAAGDAVAAPDLTGGS